MATRITTALTIVVVIACANGAYASGDDEYTAKDPLMSTLYTIDPDSPEVLGGVVGAADVLCVGADEIDPEIAIHSFAMSLTGDMDNLNAISFGVWPGCTQTRFVVLFSLDRFSIGAVPPDAGLVARGFPFNALDQALKGQAAGDAFMTMLLFTRMGFIPAHRGSSSYNNNLVVNHGDAGGVDFRLSPKGMSPGGRGRGDDGLSNLNGASGTQTSVPLDSRGVPESIMFSLAAGSQSLMTLPGTGSPADIYVDLNTFDEGGEELYIWPDRLGLQHDDDIDAMIVVDYDYYPYFDEGVDQIIFSLAPGSPTLDFGFGPGDMFTSSGNGMFSLFCPAEVIGLGPMDNINMLDYVPCSGALGCSDSWGIGIQCVGDVDGDGDVDLADLAALLSSYGLHASDAGFISSADFDDNGHINLADLAALLSNYGQSCW